MSKNLHPKCHFTFMEVHASDYQEWFECKHCGHTIKISDFEGEH
jgi:hypothetical protein